MLICGSRGAKRGDACATMALCYALRQIYNSQTDTGNCWQRFLCGPGRMPKVTATVCGYLLLPGYTLTGARMSVSGWGWIVESYGSELQHIKTRRDKGRCRVGYSEKAKALRRCTATRQDGQPCKAYARWGTQLCAAHTFKKRKPGNPNDKRRYYGYKANYEPCTCLAYAWPHKPGGGFCRWPDEPRFLSTIPASTHSMYRPGRIVHYYTRAGNRFG